jgi:hypothetical protein
MKIGNPKDFWGGVLFIALGLAFAAIAHGVSLGEQRLLAGYPMGTPARMGPGFFPFWLGVILVVLGAVMSVGAARAPGRSRESRLERFHWKELSFVLGSICLFGLLLQPLGMLLAGMILVLGASLGSATFDLRRSMLLGLFLVAFCTVVFVMGLKLPIPLCPAMEAAQSIGLCRA